MRLGLATPENLVLTKLEFWDGRSFEGNYAQDPSKAKKEAQLTHDSEGGSKTEGLRETRPDPGVFGREEIARKPTAR